MIVAAVMFSVALPPFVRVTVCVALLPTFTFPSATEEGLIPNCAWAAVPLPARAITRGEGDAVSAIEMLPLALPPAVGANVTVNVAVAPGVSVCGDNVPMLNPVPLALAPLIERLAVPELVSVTFTVAVLPSRMLPKPMLEGFAVRTA